MRSSTMTASITVRGLRKAFGDQVVLDSVDLDVPEGHIVALLGPNGAGKTTIVNILTTALRADSGHVSVAGLDPAKHPDDVRAVIGVTGQFSAVDGLLTGRENLRLMVRLHHLGAAGDQRIDNLLATFDLAESADRRVADYSGGMRRRLDLAMSLVGEPRFLFLDEPTTGLDPASRRGLWDVVRRLAQSGTTILLTTQYLEEADQLANSVAVLDGGRIVAHGTPAELKSRVGGGHVTLTLADHDLLDRASRAFPDGTRDDAELRLVVSTTADVVGLRHVLATLENADIEVSSFDLHQPDLDDVFLAITGSKGTDR